jgi:hypothetical protein
MMLELDKAAPEGAGAPEEEIEITPEMIEAGVCVLWNSGAVENPSSADHILIQEIFSVMRGLQSSGS